MLHVLSMFVKDPVLAKDDDARKCMKIVEDKLNGQNPFAVLKEDIGRNATLRRESLQEPIYKLVDRVRGDNEMWKRDKLNAFEQVDALLHIATSRDILARAYNGWRPYA
uniref:FATC domain-containing protein n=1 Tax=Hanusia phi TaxID=3032 RepID=A0A7S0EHU8_9CRYP